MTRLLDRRSRNTSKSQNTQCQSEAAHSKPARKMLVHKVGFNAAVVVLTALSTLQPAHELVQPSLAWKGITYMPWRHIGLNRGSVGSYLAASKVDMDPAQPATRPV